MRAILAAAALLAVSAPAFANQTEGNVLAYDRKAHILVMADKTVWMLPASAVVPDDLVSGDRIQIVYTSDGDNGFKTIDAIKRIDLAAPAATGGKG